jgi:diguanylate cyclase (GGDEF)-like protein
MTDAVRAVSDYYHGAADSASAALSEESFIAGQLSRLKTSNQLTTLIVAGLFALALSAMLINHLSMRKYEQETVRERDRAREVAYRDSLTGVKSKHAYVEEEEAISGQIDRGEAGEFAVVVCDVNGLKHINDTLGHKAGDAYICSACEMICEYYKHSPVFRIGGDEFAVILQGEDYQNRDALIDSFEEAGKEICAATENQWEQPRVSIGIAPYDPTCDTSVNDTIHRADECMYENKHLRTATR